VFIMSKKTVLQNAVESALPVDAVSEFDAVIAEQLDDIVKSAGMLVHVEKWESDAESTQAGIGAILHDVLLSQGDLALGWYDYVRVRFCDAYAVARGVAVSEEGLRKAWSRAFGLTGLDKPKSQSTEATAKAEQREKAKAKEAELLASVSGMSFEEVREQAKGLYEQAAEVALSDAKASKAKSDEAKRLLAVAEKMVKAEAKAFKDEAKSLKASIRTALSKCNNVDVLGEVLMLLQGAFDDGADDGAEFDDDTADLF
jgi:hypothetical protein